MDEHSGTPQLIRYTASDLSALSDEDVAGVYRTMLEQRPGQDNSDRQVMLVLAELRRREALHMTDELLSVMAHMEAMMTRMEVYGRQSGARMERMTQEIAWLTRANIAIAVLAALAAVGALAGVHLR